MHKNMKNIYRTNSRPSRYRDMYLIGIIKMLFKRVYTICFALKITDKNFT